MSGPSWTSRSGTEAGALRDRLRGSEVPGRVGAQARGEPLLNQRDGTRILRARTVQAAVDGRSGELQFACPADFVVVRAGRMAKHVA